MERMVFSLKVRLSHFYFEVNFGTECCIYPLFAFRARANNLTDRILEVAEARPMLLTFQRRIVRSFTVRTKPILDEAPSSNVNNLENKGVES